MPANPNNGGNGVGTSPEEIQHEAVAQAGRGQAAVKRSNEDLTPGVATRPRGRPASSPWYGRVEERGYQLTCWPPVGSTSTWSTASSSPDSSTVQEHIYLSGVSSSRKRWSRGTEAANIPHWTMGNIKSHDAQRTDRSIAVCDIQPLWRIANT